MKFTFVMPSNLNKNLFVFSINVEYGKLAYNLAKMEGFY